MPRKIIKSKRRKKLDGLEVCDLQWMFSGWSRGRWNMSNPLPEDYERRLWDRHKDEIMAVWLDPEGSAGSKFFPSGGPGTRPRVWWQYDAPRAPQYVPREYEAAYLSKHGLLSAAEKTALGMDLIEETDSAGC